MENWLQKLLENREILGQNGVKPETVDKLEQFSEAQKQRTKQTVSQGLVPLPKKQENAKDDEGMAKLGQALAGKLTQGSMTTDNLSGVSVAPSGSLQLQDVGSLGQKALKDEDNAKFLQQIQMFNSGKLVG